MDTNKMAPEDQHDFLSWDRSRKRGKMMFGILIMFFGLIFLLRELGVEVPRTLLHPSSFLIAIGLAVLVKHKFQKLFGYILILIGLIIKFHHYYPDLINLRIMFPIGIILGGAVMVFRSKYGHRRHDRKWDKMKDKARIFGLTDEDISPDDFVDGVSIFGSIKKQVTTKTFRGADLFTLFGGTELNLIQADFENTAVVELTTIFGGAEIIVPSDWQVRSEIVSIFGGVEDNRYHNSATDGAVKTLLLKGTCVFGGVEIKSYK